MFTIASFIVAVLVTIFLKDNTKFELGVMFLLVLQSGLLADIYIKVKNRRGL